MKYLIIAFCIAATPVVEYTPANWDWCNPTYCDPAPDA